MDARTRDLMLSDKYWENQANLFSEIYSARDLLRLPNKLFLKQRQAIIQKFVHSAPNERVLDIGCGAGELVDILSHYYGRVIGFDYSEQMLDLATNRFVRENITFQRANCTDLPIETNSIDAIFALGLLDYVPSIYAALQEFSRVLKCGSKIIFTAPKTPSFFEPLRWSSALRARLFKIPPIVNAISCRELDVLLAQSQFKLIERSSLWTAMWIVHAEKI